MKKAIVAVLVLVFIGGLSYTYLREHASQKEKMIIENQVRQYLPAYCPLDYVTVTASGINVYCSPKRFDGAPELDVAREQIRLALEEWRKTNQTYADCTLSVYFDTDLRFGDAKK